ncbi:Nonribosomal peptide synthetase 12 [Apiospora kogelbergensis]|uniref:Nonribosomal peptide synthetase 12 n=1 Tax=Apiospora kogelbergensis TaxID=1337665 RepID=A0AAW0QMJ4_9PEZI
MTAIPKQTLEEIAQSCGVVVDAIEDVYSCTPFQVGIMAQPDQRIYHHILVFAMHASVDKGRFCQAVCHVVAKNPVLRTRIVNCDLGPSQVVIANDFQVARHFTSLASFWEDQKSVEMDLGTRLLRISMVEDKLILAVHHALFDYTALHTLLNDASRVYHGEPTEDHASFKLFSDSLSSLDEDSAKAFWATKFSGQPTVYPPAKMGHIPEASQKMLKEIKLKSALYKVESSLIPSYIQAAWGLTAASYLQSESVAYGLVCSGRHAAMGGLETTLGPTIATVPVQMDVESSATITDMIKECTRDRRETQASPALQLGLLKIRQANEAAAAAARFTTLLSIVQDDVATYTRDMTFEYEHETRSPYSLNLICTLGPGIVAVQATFDETVVPQQQMSRVLNQFEHMLQTLIRSPKETVVGKLPRVGVHDRREVLEWNRTVPDVPQHCLHELLKMQAFERPDQVAVSAHDGSLTFEELHQLSDRLAYELRGRGVLTEVPVALLFEKSLWAVVAQIGILKAGGVCVPIDPEHPMVQKLAVISSSKAMLLVTSADQCLGQQNQLKKLPIETVVASQESLSAMADTKFQPLDHAATPSQAAFILFTSGSTGAPKGVILEHRNLVSALMAFGRRLGWSPGTRVLQFASSVWGASIIETLGTLMFGGCVCIPSEDSRASDLANYMASAEVECAILTPTIIRLFSPSDMRSLKTLCSAGEAVDVVSARKWSLGDVRFFNGWGQSETSVCSALAELGPDTPYPQSIGTPVGCAIWITEENDVSKLAPIGAVGQLLIEGPGVTRGYLNDEARTVESFIPPQPWTPRRQAGQDRRLYRSGDLARYYADGRIEYMGRQSNQVKLHGQKFDLGEVEKAICSSAAARGAFTTVQKAAQGQNDVLVAVVTLSDPRIPAGAELEEVSVQSTEGLAGQGLQKLRDDVASQLPSYMTPTAWLVVQDLPRTASAKLDRRRLKEWAEKKDLTTARMTIDSLLRKQLTAPVTPKEKVMYSSWAAALSVPDGKLGRESSLLRLGCDSVTAMKISSVCRREGLKVTVATLLRSESLADASAASEWLPGFADADTDGEDSVEEPESANASYAPRVDWDFDTRRPIRAALHIHARWHPVCTDEGAGDEYWNTLQMKMSTEDNQDGVDPHQLARAWQAVCDAQPVLRTFFISSISDTESAFQQIILKDVSASLSQGPVKSRLRPAADFPKPDFSAAQPPHHLHLTRVSRYIVYATIYISHALIDDRSMGILGQLLRQAYANASALAPGPDLGDYVAWDRNHRASARVYWSNYLSGVRPCLLPRSASPKVELGSSTADAGSSFHDAIPRRDASAIHAFCARQGITLANLAQVAWGIVLENCTGMESVCFGSILSQQSAVERGEETLGPLLAMVVCSFETQPDTTVAGLLRRARDDALAVLENGGCPISEMHDDLGMGHSPLFNTAMTIARIRPADIQDESGMKLEYLDHEDNPTEYPLTIGVGYDQDTYGARIWCDETKVSSSYASEVGVMFSVVVESIMQEPEVTVQALARKLIRPSFMPTTASTPSSFDKLDSYQGSSASDSGYLRSSAPSVSSAETENLSDTEADLRQLWSQILSLPADTIERTGNFFELGGNSIRAMRLVNKAREAKLMITVADVFKIPVLADLAGAVSRMPAGEPVPTKHLSGPSAPLAMHRITELAKDHACFRPDNIESVAAVTEPQAFMLAVNMERFAKACEQVVQHHALLRTVFVQQGSQLYQAVLRTLPTNTVIVEGSRDGDVDAKQSMAFDEARYLPRFLLRADEPDDENSLCCELEIRIHHVLYDAISLGLILQDFRAAYMEEPLSNTPKFCDWVSQVGSVNPPSSYEYWRGLLSQSTMTTLSPPTLPARGGSHTRTVRFRTPSRNLKTRRGLASSALNAAWAATLSLATGARDVVFGAANINRSRSFPNVVQVPGPCLNLVPVRATLPGHDTLGALVERLQRQATDGIPHQNLGFRSVARACTDWPAWTRLGSVVVYQNHEAVGDTLGFGDVEAAFSGVGTIGDSTDFWVIAHPAAEPEEDDEVEVEIIYAPQRTSDQQAQWVSRCLEAVLASVHTLLEQPLESLQGLMDEPVPSHVPVGMEIAKYQGNIVSSGSPTTQAQAIVTRAWNEVGLPDQPSDVEGHGTPPLYCKGDLVTVVMLAWWYRYRGYDISMYDIIDNPTILGQSQLLDKSLEKRIGHFAGVDTGALLDLTIATLAAPNPAISDFDWTTVTPSTSLNYTSCYDHAYKCAKLVVPLDWLSADSPTDDTRHHDKTKASTVALAIIARPAIVPASDPRHGGTILTNPGGPAGSGVGFLLRAGALMQRTADSAARGRHYEILSFDPRGVGLTEPRADCFGGDEFARGAAWWTDRGLGPVGEAAGDGGRGDLGAVRRAMARARGLGGMCEGKNAGAGGEGGIWGFMSTSSVARDMVAIVDKLEELRVQTLAVAPGTGGADEKDGEEQQRIELRSSNDAEPDPTPRIQFWGLSYGTALGNYFASMFPGRVGRMILEGVEDVNNYHSASWSVNLRDTQHVLDHFWETCYRGGKACALYRPTDGDATAIRDRVRSFIDSLETNPAPFVSHATNNFVAITKHDVLEAILKPLYQPLRDFPHLAQLLSEAMQGNITLLYDSVNKAPTHEDSCRNETDSPRLHVGPRRHDGRGLRRRRAPEPPDGGRVRRLRGGPPEAAERRLRLPRGPDPAVLYRVAHPPQVPLRRALDHARSRPPTGAGQAGGAHFVRVQPVRPGDAVSQCAGHDQGASGLAGASPGECGTRQSLFTGEVSGGLHQEVLRDWRIAT